MENCTNTIELGADAREVKNNWRENSGESLRPTIKTQIASVFCDF